MKITFIGTSHGVPEPNRKCSCIMIEVGERVYFVDMGCSAMNALRTRGISIDAVRGVFITHMHSDHTNGLIEFVGLISWYFKTARPTITLPMPEAGKVIDEWFKISDDFRECAVEYRETQAGLTYDDGFLKVIAIPTQHFRKSFAYLIEADGQRVLFTGDLKNPQIDFPMAEGKIDLLICEAAHFSATDYLPVLGKLDIQKICVTHYSDRFLVSALQLRENMTERGVPVLLATDDLEIPMDR